jgi:hypothetical protein
VGFFGRRESHGGNPVRVSLVAIVGELAVTNGVPDLDGAVTASRNNLSVVGRERDRQNVTGVANESLESGSVVKVPQTECLIPRSRDSKITILRDGNVLDNVGVSMERSLGNTVRGLVSGQVPDDQGLITGSGNENVGVASRGSKGSDPTAVAFKGSSEDENFVLTHAVDFFNLRVNRVSRCGEISRQLSLENPKVSGFAPLC